MSRVITFNLVLLAMLIAVCGAAFAQTAEQNMAAQSKQHIIPGKQLHAVGPNYEFCEVASYRGHIEGKCRRELLQPDRRRPLQPGTVHTDRSGQRENHQGRGRNQCFPESEPSLDVG